MRTDFEYALIVLEGAVAVHGRPLLPGRLGYLGEGRDELRLEVRQPARAVAGPLSGTADGSRATGVVL
ncbi:hypothetical protein ACFYR1_31285 [Streptomyces canus]|uniref:hypothetical protein n=1 Tax=Streptomyces canus TaxID=58343 RepID=UPI0036BC04D2